MAKKMSPEIERAMAQLVIVVRAQLENTWKTGIFPNDPQAAQDNADAQVDDFSRELMKLVRSHTK